jgi:hypothetical protein
MAVVDLPENKDKNKKGDIKTTVIELTYNEERKEAEKYAKKLIDWFKLLTGKMDYDGIRLYETRLIINEAILIEVIDARMKLYQMYASKDPYFLIVRAYIDKHIRENRDFLCWINMFGWTYNPIHTDQKITPFIAYPYHLDFWETINRYPKTITIKSRTMGYTWFKAYTKVFRAIYDDDYKSLITSRVEDDIDIGGDKYQTIMGRIRFILETLPQNYRADTDKFMMLTIGDNAIMGTTSASDAMRSKRATEVDVEEAGVIEDFTSLMASVSSVSNELRLGGTVKGTSNGFYDYWRNRENAYYHIFWSFEQHPIFNCQDWVDMQKALYNNDDRLFNQEIMADFFAMVGNYIFCNLNETHMTDLSYMNYERMVKCVSVDPGLGDSLCAVWFFYYDPEHGAYYYVDYAEFKNTLADEIADEIVARGFQDCIMLLDSYGKNRDSSGGGWAINFSQYFEVYLVDNKEIQGTIILANKNFRDGLIKLDSSSTGIQKGFSRLTKYIFQDKYGSEKVEKNEDSDCGDAFRYSQAMSMMYREVSSYSRAVLQAEILAHYSKNKGTGILTKFSI